MNDPEQLTGRRLQRVRARDGAAWDLAGMVLTQAIKHILL
jgi:hypothetical protein